MSTASDPRHAPVTWADVNRDVARTVSIPGNGYFAWMCVVVLTLMAGVLAWTTGTKGDRTATASVATTGAPAPTRSSC